jgi:hypothetical protein
MEPISIPDEAKTARPDMRVLRIGPPPGVSEDECGTVEALVGAVDGYPAYADYWRPTTDELDVLTAGGYIELVQYAPRMVMHSMAICPVAGEIRAAEWKRADRDGVVAFTEVTPGVVHVSTQVLEQLLRDAGWEPFKR